MGVREPIALAAALLCACLTAQAQTYPTKELNVVVGLPAGAPPPIVLQLEFWFNQIVKMEATRDYLARTHATAFPGDAKTLAAFLPKEIWRWRELSRLAKIVPQ